MASQGPLTTGTGADDATVGTVAWTNPGNITVQDYTYATCNIASTPATSHYLKATNFGFTIPAGSTVDGVTVTMDRGYTGFGSPQNNLCKLVIGGSIVGVSRGAGSFWSSSETATYGSSSDLWGNTPTVSQVNASDFGMVMSAKDDFASFTTLRVDRVQITIDYTLAPTNYYNENPQIRRFSQTRHGIYLPIGSQGIQIF